MAVSDPSTPDPCTSDSDAAPLLDALGDDVSREILSAGMRRAVTAEELAADCGVSESTIYRRLESLCDLGLVERCNHLVSDADAKSSYRAVVDGLSVELDADGVRVDRATETPLIEAMETVLEALDLRHLSYDARTNSVDVEFTLDDAQLATLVLLRDRLSTPGEAIPAASGSVSSR